MKQKLRENKKLQTSAPKIPLKKEQNNNNSRLRLLAADLLTSPELLIGPWRPIRMYVSIHRNRYPVGDHYPTNSSIR
jgi:hypothetical protein